MSTTITETVEATTNTAPAAGKEEDDDASPPPPATTLSRRVSAADEEEFYPMTFQEELNEIVQAFYDAVGEEDMYAYQKWVESVQKMKIAEQAVDVSEIAPDFDLEDQDGDRVCLSEILQKGPVVLVFYRGKWCPFCNATIMRMQRSLNAITAKGATLIAISPMLPDGTHYMATKKCIDFSVLSDVGNVIADKYKISFPVEPEFRNKFLDWGEDIPTHNGDDTWKIPIPATYVIDQNQRIVFSHLENDPGIRADPQEVLTAIPSSNNTIVAEENEDEEEKKAEENTTVHDGNEKTATADTSTSGSGRRRSTAKRRISATFVKPFKKVFGKKNQSSSEFLYSYLKY